MITDSPTTEQTGKQRAADYAARHFRWNFAVLIADACLFWSGLAFFEPTIIVPVLLAKLHASNSLIGFLRFIQAIGYTVPALLAAHYIHGRPRHKDFLLACCAIGRIGLFTLPPILLFCMKAHPGFVLAWIAVSCAVFWVMDGGCSISWFDIIGKTIPPGVRGRFFGTMQMVGGVLSAAGAVVAGWILDTRHLSDPRRFALLGTLWCLGTLGSQIALYLIREPDGAFDVEEEKPPFWVYLRQALPLVRGNRRLRMLILSRICLDGAGMAVPFYVLYATKDLRQAATMVGLYLMAQSLGKISTGQVWGWISDKRGPALGFRCVAGCILTIPLLAVLAAHGSPLLMFGVYFLLGAVADGAWMVFNTALMESVSERDRAFAIGVANVILAPGAIYGLIGGLIAQYASYPILFGVAGGFALAGLVLALRVPRRPTVSPGV